MDSNAILLLFFAVIFAALILILSGLIIGLAFSGKKSFKFFAYITGILDVTQMVLHGYVYFNYNTPMPKLYLFLTGLWVAAAMIHFTVAIFGVALPAKKAPIV